MKITEALATSNVSHAILHESVHSLNRYAMAFTAIGNTELASALFTLAQTIENATVEQEEAFDAILLNLTTSTLHTGDLLLETALASFKSRK